MVSQVHERPIEAPVFDDEPTNVEQLYREHRGWLLRFLHRRFGGLVAEDLAQEAFVRTLGTRTTVRNPRAFLATVAVRAALEQAQRQPRDFTALQTSSVAPDAEEAMLLEQLILKLPPPLREVLLLSRFGGLSNVEIAQRCSLSLKRVEARITQARTLCAALMRD
jgi:RNA polymerase sigma factor (sigma-70 family)